MSGRVEYTEVSPEDVEALGDVYNYVTQSGLSDVLVELVYLRVSQINGCAYCVDVKPLPCTEQFGK
jgi:alkylhydroperoxidase family enzyme